MRTFRTARSFCIGSGGSNGRCGWRKSLGAREYKKSGRPLAARPMCIFLRSPSQRGYRRDSYPVLRVGKGTVRRRFGGSALLPHRPEEGQRPALAKESIAHRRRVFTTLHYYTTTFWRFVKKILPFPPAHSCSATERHQRLAYPQAAFRKRKSSSAFPKTSASSNSASGRVQSATNSTHTHPSKEHAFAVRIRAA